MPRYGGPGNRNPNRKQYAEAQRPNARRPLPADFRERYLENGWEAQWYYETGWRIMCRWIDEAGGQELIDARAAWLKENGINMPNKVVHKSGWDAEKLDSLTSGQAGALPPIDQDILKDIFSIIAPKVQFFWDQVAERQVATQIR